MIFSFPIRIYWEDTDAGGIVFYANYLKFFERARTEWLRSLGITQQALREASGQMFVVSESNIKYHRPARLDDELLVSTQLHHAGRSSLALRQLAVAKTNPDHVHCEGLIRVAWVDAATLKPCRIPPAILKAIES